MTSDTEYLRVRIAEEREAATRASDKRAKMRHLELAAAYAFRVRELAVQERRSALQLFDAA